MSETPSQGTTASFNSGFCWRIEVPDERPFDRELLLALRDTFRQAGQLQAARMEHPPLRLSFSHAADMLGRLWPGLLRASACTLPLAPLALPSGAMGYLHLSAWPLLLAALEERGVTADGSAVNAGARRAAPDRATRGRPPRVRFRLQFDPERVGPLEENTDLGRPPAPTALELGAPHK
jgi:hypothetical protein